MNLLKYKPLFDLLIELQHYQMQHPYVHEKMSSSERKVHAVSNDNISVQIVEQPENSAYYEFVKIHFYGRPDYKSAVCEINIVSREVEIIKPDLLKIQFFYTPNNSYNLSITPRHRINAMDETGQMYNIDIPLTEEQHFQQSTLHDLKYTFEEYDMLNNFTKLLTPEQCATLQVHHSEFDYYFNDYVELATVALKEFKELKCQ